MCPIKSNERGTIRSFCEKVAYTVKQYSAAQNVKKVQYWISEAQESFQVDSHLKFHFSRIQVTFFVYLAQSSYKNLSFHFRICAVPIYVYVPLQYHVCRGVETGRAGGALVPPLILQKIICFTLITHFYIRMYYTIPFVACSYSKSFENDAVANIDDKNS